MTSIDPALWRRVNPLLDEVLALDAADRAVRIAALRSADPALADVLLDLLREKDFADEHQFLQAGAITMAAALSGVSTGTRYRERRQHIRSRADGGLREGADRAGAGARVTLIALQNGAVTFCAVGNLARGEALLNEAQAGLAPTAGAAAMVRLLALAVAALGATPEANVNRPHGAADRGSAPAAGRCVNATVVSCASRGPAVVISRSLCEGNGASTLFAPVP